MPVFGHREDKSKAEIGIKTKILTLPISINLGPGMEGAVSNMSERGAYNGYAVIGVYAITQQMKINGVWKDVTGSVSLRVFNAYIDEQGRLIFNCDFYNYSNSDTYTASEFRFQVRLAFAKKDMMETN